jgi:hypothetical protein
MMSAVAGGDLTGTLIAVRARAPAGIQMTATDNRLRVPRNTMENVPAEDGGEIAPNSHAPIVKRAYSSSSLRIEAAVMMVAAVHGARNVPIELLNHSQENPRFCRFFSRNPIE